MHFRHVRQACRSGYGSLSARAILLGGALAACGSSSPSGNLGTGSSGGSSGGASTLGPDGSAANPDTGAPYNSDTGVPTTPDGGGTTQGGGTDAAAPPGWVLTWSDEFNTADGTQPDPSKWTYDLGDGTSAGSPGWGNAELESYTNNTQNVVIQGGNLAITARVSTDASLMCNGTVCGYTSGRIHTQGKFSQTYGRFEARIKIPSGSGVWPAFWMMGEQFTQANWPQYGEIDVMENAGSMGNEVRGSIHGPGGSATYTDNGLSGPDDLATGNFSDAFHVFAMEWDVGTISFFVDSTKYYTVTTAEVTAVGQGATWPFDNDPNFILLNFAVDSGNFGDPPNAQTVWPQQMLVDYVRVYKKQ